MKCKLRKGVAFGAWILAVFTSLAWIGSNAWAVGPSHAALPEPQQQGKLYSPFATYNLKTFSGGAVKATLLKSTATKRTLASAINKVIGGKGPGVSITLEKIRIEPGKNGKANVTLVAFNGEEFALAPVSIADLEAGRPVSLRYHGTERFNQFPGGLFATGTATATLRFYPETGNLVVTGLRGSVNVRWGVFNVSDTGTVGDFRGVRAL